MPTPPMTMPAATLDRARFDAAIFDLDGVITRTARLHARAWQETFDEFLRRRGSRDGGAHEAFDVEADYRRFVDGKPRDDGVRDFLRSRGIELPRGDRGDAPGSETVCGLGNRKNDRFLALLATEGAEVFAPAIALVRRLRRGGFATAVVSSSRNCKAVLESVGALDLFDVRIDGVLAHERGLKGKPAADTFLTAAGELRVAPQRTVVFEDSMAGVAAGRAGAFALVVGVDRSDQAEALRAHGAHVVVADLSAIEVAD